MTYQPPFHLTHTITKRAEEISELIGAGATLANIDPEQLATATDLPAGRDSN